MAKTIQISSDGTTWYKLPGSQGSFQATADEADDTIFGQTFKSGETGLIGWTVESDGIFKGFAGYHSKIKKTGTPATTTGEAASLVSGKTYRVDDTTKDIISRTASITVYDGVTDVTDEVVSINYLFGEITFDAGYTVSGSVTLDYTYIPLVDIAAGNAYTLTMSAETKDTTTYPVAQANGGFKTCDAGLRTVSLEIQGVFSASEDARTDLSERNELICEVDVVGNGSSVARGYFKYSTAGQSGNVGALEDETLNFVLSVPYDELLSTAFDWKHTNTTLAQSIQMCITSWLDELNTYEVRYLPNGVVGASPEEGTTGAFCVTDISLNGSLDGMNIFNIALQGNGAYTTV